MPHNILRHQVNDTPQINKAYLLILLNLKFTTPEEMFKNTKLSLSLLNSIETVDVSIAIQIVHNLNKFSSEPNWPAILGAHLGVASHGPVGYATISAPTVGKALMTFVEWYQIRSETYSAQIIQQNEAFEIIVSDTSGDAAFQETFFEAFMRAFEVLIQLLVGHSPQKETELHFKTFALNRRKAMEKEYDSLLFFGADTNKLLIPKNIWIQPSPLYDIDSYDFNIRKCQQLLAEMEQRGRIDLQVRNMIRKHFDQMVLSSDPSISPPTQTQICSKLYVTERTMIRKLKELNTSYKNILEKERRMFSERLLQKAKYTIYDIAEILGYREPANFCRAFKSWFGKSPSDFRRN